MSCPQKSAEDHWISPVDRMTQGCLARGGGGRDPQFETSCPGVGHGLDLNSSIAMSDRFAPIVQKKPYACF